MACSPLFVVALVSPGSRASDNFAGFDFYVGDPHGHTGVSEDGGSSDDPPGGCLGDCAAFAEVFETARANGLDWVALSDHVNGGNAASLDDFAMLHAAVLAAHDPAGGFVTVPAGEVWFVQGCDHVLGHKNLLLFGDNETLADMDLTDFRPGGVSATMTVAACDDIWAWMADLADTWGDALLIPHHPALERPMPTDWDCQDSTWSPAVEVYSEHGNSLEKDAAYDPPWSGEHTAGTVEAAISPDEYGLRLGFMGGTDKHDTRPGGVCHLDTEHPLHPFGGGLTIVYQEEGGGFDRPELYDAIVSHHTYASTGLPVPLVVHWSSDGAVLGGLGDDLVFAFGAGLDVAVSVPPEWVALVTEVVLIGPDDRRWTLTEASGGTWTGRIGSGEVPAYLVARVELDGSLYYDPGECDDGGADQAEFLWASPSWLTDDGGDYDGDGVTVADGDCNDGRRWVRPGAWERWYDGIDQDCDGASDFDADRDGHDSADHGGDDCDDHDRWVHPGAWERWYDGIDQDCDGASDYDRDGDGHDAMAYGGDDFNDRNPAVP
ncbi:MAG: hypothetical protein D6798_15685 [Deltaproteobacteria bacterium]|nr:MAG: hypothetical protein D6798_15685 [Deltaproteobacteria bacterium]